MIAGVGTDHDRLALERGEIVVPLTGMGDQHRRVLLKDRRDRHHRDVLACKIERTKGVRREVEVEPAGGEQLRMIDLRPALPQRDLEPVPPVDAGGDRLIVAAVLGLGLPVGAEADGSVPPHRDRALSRPQHKERHRSERASPAPFPSIAALASLDGGRAAVEPRASRKGPPDYGIVRRNRPFRRRDWTSAGSER